METTRKGTAHPWLTLAAIGALAVARAGAAQEVRVAPGAGTEPSPVGGAPATDPLGAMVAEALRNNLSLAQARLGEERAAAQVREARGRYLPSLALNSRHTELAGAVDLGDFVNPAYGALNRITGTNQFPTDVSVTLPLRHESRVRLAQPLFNERIRAGLSAAGREYDGQRAQRLTRARQVAADAQVAFLLVAATRSARRIWEATVPLVEESERVATRLVDAGTATPDAIFRARAERSEVEQKLAEARESEASAARAFNRLLHRPLDAPVDPIDEAALGFEITMSEAEAVERALARREELAVFDAGIEAARAGVRVATAGYLPEVAVALDYGFQGRELSFAREQDFWTASLVVSWNLFDGGQDLARRQAAVADLDALRVRREETVDLIRLDVRQAYQAAVVARDAIATAADRLAAAERSFALVRRRFQEGLAAPIEFLDARTALTSAELNRVLTVNRFAVRWVELERAAALRDVANTEKAPWN